MNRFATRWLLLVGALVVSVVGSACTDDGDSIDANPEATAPATSAPTDFVGKANLICERGNERIDGIFSGFSQDEVTAEQRDAAFRAFLDDVAGQVDDIEALEVPDDIAGEVATWLEAARAALVRIEAAGPGPFFSSEANEFAEANELAVDLGLGVCGA